MIRKHTLKVNHSKVLEVLSVIRAKALGQESPELQQVLEAIVVPQKFDDIMQSIKENSDLAFGYHEFITHTPERNDLSGYFNNILSMDKQERLMVFLGFNGDTFSGNIFSSQGDVCQSFKDELANRGTKNIESICELISNFEAYTKKYLEFALHISQDKAFLESFTPKVNTDLDEMVSEMKLSLKDRHPTSYAQALMGKSFWNISDWTEHEFIPIYFNTPMTLRIYNENKNIILRGLYKRDISSQELATVLKDKLKLLSDPKRLSILRMTYMKPMYGKEIADALNLTTATVSHHLDLLRKAQLLNMEQERHIKYFSTNTRAFDKLLSEMTKYIKE